MGSGFGKLDAMIVSLGDELAAGNSVVNRGLSSLP
jgi:hypothetical protein